MIIKYITYFIYYHSYNKHVTLHTSSWLCFEVMNLAFSQCEIHQTFFGISKVALFFVPIMGVATPLLEADTHQQTKHGAEFNVIIEYIYIYYNI